MLIARMVHDEVDDHPHPTAVRLVHELDEIRERAELRLDRCVARDVVAAVPHRRGIERRQPETVHAEPGEVIQLGGKARQVALAVTIRIIERPDEHLIKDRALEPLRIPLGLRDIGERIDADAGRYSRLSHLRPRPRSDIHHRGTVADARLRAARGGRGRPRLDPGRVVLGRSGRPTPRDVFAHPTPRRVAAPARAR
jgi:hypothetical protein